MDGSVPSTGGLGELQNSGNFSLSMARSSLSNLGLSNRGAKCLMGNMNEGQYQSASLLTQHGVKQIGLSPTGTIGPYSDP